MAYFMPVIPLAFYCKNANGITVALFFSSLLPPPTPSLPALMCEVSSLPGCTDLLELNILGFPTLCQSQPRLSLRWAMTTPSGAPQGQTRSLTRFYRKKRGNHGASSGDPSPLGKEQEELRQRHVPGAKGKREPFSGTRHRTGLLHGPSYLREGTEK